MKTTDPLKRISASIQNTHASLLGAPSTTGVYIYKLAGKPIYVGKAVSLKARLLSHEQNASQDSKEAQIVSQADTIDLIYTDSEFQALLLEAHLISLWKPKYNVRWRDDKSYLYIKITVKDLYPKVLLSRKENDGASRYFGPFGSVKSAEFLLKRIRRIVHFCMQNGIQKRPCFYHKIGLCDPCPSAIEQVSDASLKKEKQTLYKKNIKTLLKILEGKTDIVFRSFRKEIAELTKNQQFEQAIQTRDAMNQLELLLRFGDLTSLDNLLINRPQQSLQALMELLTPFYPNLSSLHRIECYDNSTLSFEHSTASMIVFTDGMVDKKEYRRFKIKGSLNNDFDMMKEVLARRAEHTGWTKPDLIVIDGGRPQLHALKQLSIFNLQSSKVVSSKPPSDESENWDWKIGIIPIIGIAKNPDRLVVWDTDGFAEIKPARHNLGFRLIQNMRDEAHRFAKKYHTYLRNKAQMVQ